MIQNNWYAFNFILSENINLNINEQLFESKVIQAFGELGWKEYLNNIEIRPTLHIGSVNRIEPDLLFKSDKGSNLFVVEVKRPGIDLNQDHQKQLFSYMRQLKLDYGILIGKEIQIFYDGPLSENSNPICLNTISFEANSDSGLTFIELFSKESFSFNKLNDFTTEQILKISDESQVEKLKEIIFSSNFTVDLEKIIKNHFTNNFNERTIKKAFENIIIEVKEKSNTNTSNYAHKNYSATNNQNNLPKRGERLNIELNPNNPNEFKSALLQKKGAWITVTYRDGKSTKEYWNANNMTESSNVLGNLRSRPNFRNGKWQQLGISKVMVSIY